MQQVSKFVGLDVHKASIAVAVADRGEAPVRYLERCEPKPELIAKLVKRLGPAGELHFCYEAGPTGYGLYRQLTQLGATCTVVAPTLIPTKVGDKVKTDRKDAMRLASLLRAGELTACWVPDEAYEAFRNLTRERTVASQKQQRIRQRLGHLLLRLGVEPPIGIRRWGPRHRAWLEQVRLKQAMNQLVLRSLLGEWDQAAARLEALTRAVEEAAESSAFAPLIKALACLYGVGIVTAAAETAEIGDFGRFASPRSLFNYLGLTPREASSGPRTRRGSITKAGNQHARWLLIEASWHYPRLPKASKALTQRRQGQDPTIIAIADAARQRLYTRYWRLLKRGKLPQQAVVAIARELAGFMWAIARELKTVQPQQATASPATAPLAQQAS